MDRTSKGHYCVDYCQPPQHSDLCYSNVEYDLVGNHLMFEADYWHLYRVGVIMVRRLPDLDGANGDDFGKDRKGQQIKTHYIRTGDKLPQKAFEVRWRGDVQREPNRLKRLHAMQHIYGACKFTNCDYR